MLRVFQRLAPIVELQVAGRLIRTTLEHPFRPVEGGWTPAGELELGQLLVTLQAAGVPVESLRATGEMATVYNLEVEDHHTYFVSGDDWGFAVWAHNASYAQLAANRKQGLDFQDDVVAALGASRSKWTKGTTSAGKSRLTLADGELPALLEVKSGKYVSYSPQLQTQISIGQSPSGQGNMLVVASHTTVSGPTLKAYAIPHGLQQYSTTTLHSALCLTRPN